MEILVTLIGCGYYALQKLHVVIVVNCLSYTSGFKLSYTTADIRIFIIATIFIAKPIMNTIENRLLRTPASDVIKPDLSTSFAVIGF